MGDQIGGEQLGRHGQRRCWNAWYDDDDGKKPGYLQWERIFRDNSFFSSSAKVRISTNHSCAAIYSSPVFLVIAYNFYVP